MRFEDRVFRQSAKPPAQLVHWIPRIAFVEDHLPSGCEKLVHNLEELRCVAAVQQVYRDHAVKATAESRSSRAAASKSSIFASISGGHCDNF